MMNEPLASVHQEPPTTAAIPSGLADPAQTTLVTATTAEPEPLPNVLKIDEAQLRHHLDQLVRDSVEQTLNSLLDAEAVRSESSRSRRG